jgi:hypothetical protein
MDRQQALRLISEKAYDVGYSAKLHYSTYDIVEKAPGWIGLVSLIIGVLSLYIDFLAAKHISAAITVVGICGIYIALYSDKKDEYYKTAQQLTGLLDRLKNLHAECKSGTTLTVDQHNELEMITQEFRSACMSKHILFSSWLAHKKFFWEQQIDWIEEDLEFTLLRDKLPFSLYLLIGCLIGTAIAWVIYHPERFSLIQRICAQ